MLATLVTLVRDSVLAVAEVLARGGKGAGRMHPGRLAPLNRARNDRSRRPRIDGRTSIPPQVEGGARSPSSEVVGRLGAGGIVPFK